MVAKAPTPQWGNAQPDFSNKPSDNLDPGDIPAFLKRDHDEVASEPKQTDIEDFTGAPPLAGEEAPEPTDAEGAERDPSNGAPQPGPDTPEPEQRTVPVPEIDMSPASVATGGDGRELKRDDNAPRTATVVDDAAGTVAGQQLLAFVERYERLDEEKQTIAEDQREVLAEAKGTGFDVPTIRRLIQLRKMDPATRQERESLMDIYKSAIGME